MKLVKIDVLDKPLHYTLWQKITLLFKHYPLVGVASILIILSSLLGTWLLIQFLVNWIRHEPAILHWQGAIGIVLFMLVSIFCIGGTLLPSEFPTRVTSGNPPNDQFSMVPALNYVVKSDQSAMKKIADARDTLYYDQDRHILNQFPTTVSKKAKNEATLDKVDINHVILHGTKNTALMELGHSDRINQIKKIVAVSEKDGKTTVYYTEKPTEKKSADNDDDSSSMQNFVFIFLVLIVAVVVARL